MLCNRINAAKYPFDQDLKDGKQDDSSSSESQLKKRPVDFKNSIAELNTELKKLKTGTLNKINFNAESCQDNLS